MKRSETTNGREDQVMTGKSICPRCGVPLPGGRWGVVCPACVARVSLTSVTRRNLAKTRTGNSAPTGSSRKTSSFAISSPGRFGDYELLEEIARGGMGIVWRARQCSVNRMVALKLLRTAEFARPEDAGRFRSEAAAVASLQHPHIVALHDFGEHQGQPWLSLDFVEGRTLAELIRNRPLPPRQAAELLKTVAEAVAHAHDRGILHRDIKPSNILMDREGRPRITDFGLAKRLTEPEPGTPNPDLTLTGQLLGTPSYAPPEQLAVHRGTLGPHSDVYALGAVLYEMLTGQPPFVGATVEATLLQVIDAEPAPPRKRHPAVPMDLETICLKCLEKPPARRYPTALDLADELGRFLRHEPIQARPINAIGQFGRWCRRKPGWAVSGALALVLSATLGTLAILTSLRQAEQQRQAAAIASSGLAVPVKLWNATATFSQPGFPINAAIDGNTVTGGWAIRESRGAADETHAQTAVFQTETDLGYPHGSLLTFKLTQNRGQQHTLGRFRLSVTSDDRRTFAGGQAVGGDVTADWTVLHPSAVFTASGRALQTLADGSVISSGEAAHVDTYTITAPTPLTGITGVRLEVLPYEHGLPFFGPGNHEPDGNFVLTEFELAVSSANALGNRRPDEIDTMAVRLADRFMETEFADSDWELHIRAEPPSGRASTSRILESRAATGSRRAHQRIAHALGGASAESALLSIHLNTNAVYLPANQGSIAFLEFVVDARTFSTEVHTYGGQLAPALRQNGRIYLAKMYFRTTRDDHQDPRLPSPWKVLRYPRLRATDFLLVTGAMTCATEYPDFSTNAATITFGYALQSSHNSGDPVVRQVDVDNWSVDIYARAP
ncbi:MAG: serine/threonine protein kinase [Verrucomicrobiae bacterium]|nr:serine/threonine protein kinase [Verrucomicrobiae bacterium]